MADAWTTVQLRDPSDKLKEISNENGSGNKNQIIIPDSTDIRSFLWCGGAAAVAEFLAPEAARTP